MTQKRQKKYYRKEMQDYNKDAKHHKEKQNDYKWCCHVPETLNTTFTITIK